MRLRLKTGAIGNAQYDKVLSALLFLYCAAMPFEEALAFSFGGILKIIGFLVIGWCLLAHYKTRIRLRKLFFVLPFFWWFMFSLLSVAWSKDHTWWWYFIKTYASQIILLMTIVSYRQFVNLEHLKNGVVTGAVIAAAVLIVMPMASTLTEDGRRTMIVFGNELDPNILAAVMMVALIITVERIIQKRSGTLLIVLAAFILLGILLTGSRGGLIATAVGGVTYLVINVKNGKIRNKVMLLTLAAVIAVAIVVALLPDQLISSRFSWKSLFGFDEYESGAHNRWTIWKYALPLSLNAPIVGYGCGGFFYAIATVYRQTASHNLYILLLIEGGLVGLSLFVAGLLRIFRSACKHKNHAMIALLMSVGVMSLTLDAISTKFFWMALIIATLTLGDPNELPKPQVE